jgi:hypothetical protein
LIAGRRCGIVLQRRRREAAATEADAVDVEMAPAELDAPVEDGRSSDGDGSPSDGVASSEEEDEMDAAKDRAYREEQLEGFLQRGGTQIQLEDLYAQLRPRQGRVIRWRSKEERAREKHFHNLPKKQKRRKLVELVLGTVKASPRAEEAAWRADEDARTERLRIVLMWNMVMSDPFIPASYEELMDMTKALLERVVMKIEEEVPGALGPMGTRPSKTTMQGRIAKFYGLKKEPEEARATCALCEEPGCVGDCVHKRLEKLMKGLSHETVRTYECHDDECPCKNVKNMEESRATTSGTVKLAACRWCGQEGDGEWRRRDRCGKRGPRSSEWYFFPLKDPRCAISGVRVSLLRRRGEERRPTGSFDNAAAWKRPETTPQHMHEAADLRIITAFLNATHHNSRGGGYDATKDILDLTEAFKRNARATLEALEEIERIGRDTYEKWGREQARRMVETREFKELASDMACHHVIKDANKELYNGFPTGASICADFATQGALCRITYGPLSMKTAHNRPSMDRLDNDDGHHKGNRRYVGRPFNTWCAPSRLQWLRLLADPEQTTVGLTGEERGLLAAAIGRNVAVGRCSH